MTVQSRTRDPLLLALVVALVAIAVVRLWLAARVNVWTGADEFHYVTLAHSILEGRGLVVDYVRFFFVPYDRIAGRPEDMFYPLFSISMVPFIALFGRTFLAYSVVPVLAQTVALPLLSRALAMRLGAGRGVAYCVAVTVLLHPLIFLQANSPMPYAPWAALFTAVFLLYLNEPLRPRTLVGVGVLLGLAILWWPSSYWAVLALPLTHAVRRGSWRAAFGREMLLMLVCAGLVVAPFWIRNLLLFGDPMHSLYTYQSGLTGRYDVPGSFYGFWWDTTPPGLLDRYTSGAPGRPFLLFFRYLLIGIDMLFFGTIKTAGITRIYWGPYNYHLYQLLFGPLALWVIWRRKHDWRALLLVIHAALLILIVAAVRNPQHPRYFLPLYPYLLTYGWIGWERIGSSRLASRFVRGRRRWLVGLCVLFAVPALALDIYRTRDLAGPMLPSARTSRDAEADALIHAAEVLPPDAVVLDGPAARANYYTRRAAVSVPEQATPEQLARIIDHYGCTHAYLPDSPLLGWLDSRGWRPVPELGEGWRARP